MIPLIQGSRFRLPAPRSRGVLKPALGFLVALLLGGLSARAEESLVSRVIDGDTVQLSDGRLIRYLGVDAPEVRRRVGEIWVKDPEPFGEAAMEANRRLVERKRIRLEYDVVRRDRFGRWLAYVYVGDMLVNAELVRLGFAHPLTVPPNVRYADRLRALAGEARRERRGLWADAGDRSGVN